MAQSPNTIELDEILGTAARAINTRIVNLEGTLSDSASDSTHVWSAAKVAALIAAVPQGAKGDSGEQGPVGPQGPQGEQGPQGIQGIQGPAGTGINFIGSLESAGELPDSDLTNGDAWIIGTSLYIWSETDDSFVNSGNIQGPQGIQGEKGEKGDKGDKGDSGEQGPQGIQGEKGDTGDAGDDGTRIYTGSTVPSAALGVDGDFYHRSNGIVYKKVSSAWVLQFDLTGPEGPVGPQGPSTPANLIFLDDSSNLQDALDSQETALIAASISAKYNAPFASRGAALLGSVPADIEQISVIHNDMVLSYVRDDAGTALTTADGAKWAPVPPVYLEHYGVVTATSKTTAADHTAAVQRAFAATQGDLLFSGWVKVTDRIVGTLGCRPHSVRGRSMGGFSVFDDFNAAATGVYRPAASGEGASIGELGFWFDQSDAAASGDRADLVHYPPAIDLTTGGTRIKIEAVRIEQAWDGIDAQGNIGGAIIGTLEIGAFNLGLKVDGASDFVHIDTLHFWPFGMAADEELLAIYQDGATQGLVLGEADGWVCKSLVSFQASVTVNNAPGPDGLRPAQYIPHVFHSVTLDGHHARFYWQNGHGAIGAYTSQDLLHVSGGDLEINGYLVGSSDPIVQLSGGNLNLAGCTVETQALTNVILLQDGGNLSAVGLHLKGVTGTRTASAIKQTGGSAEIAALTTGTLNGAAPLVEVTSTDSINRIDLGRNRGYKLTIPAGMTLGHYVFPSVRVTTRLDFPDRDTAKTNHNAYHYPAGTVLRALDTGLEWIVDGASTAIADMVGVKPLGDVTPDHFKNNTTPGTTDMTTAIQAAIDYVSGLTGGGVVKLLASKYFVSDEITIDTNGVGLVGAGKYTTWITRSGDYGNTVVVTGNDATGTLVQNVVIGDLAFESTGATTSGSHLLLNGANQVSVHDVNILNGFEGIHFQGATAVAVTNLRIVYANLFSETTDGRRYLKFEAADSSYAHPSCGDLHVSGFNIRSNTTVHACEVGIEITSADGIWFTDGHVGNTDFANIWLKAEDSANPIGLVSFNGVMSDECQGDGIKFSGNAVDGRNITFADGPIKGGGNGDYGIHVDSAATFKNIQFSDVSVSEFTKHGVYCKSDEFQNVTFTNCQVRGNSYGSAGSFGGYWFDNGQKIQIVGGASGGHNLDPYGTKTQYAGLRLNSACRDFIVSGVDLSYNVNGPTSIVAAARSTLVMKDVISDRSHEVASTGTIDFYPDLDFIVVTGTTAVSNAHQANPGRRVVVKFEDSVTISGSGNIKPKISPYTSQPGDVLHLVYDGTNWIEVSQKPEPVWKFPMTRTLAEATSVSDSAEVLTILASDMVLSYVRDSDGTALTTADGANWSPVPPVYLEHFGVVTAATPAAAANYSAKVQNAFNFTQGDLLFTGWVKVIDRITGKLGCRPHSVRGRTLGGFAVDSDFNMDATGVYRPATAGEGASIGELGFHFDQSAAAASGDRADLIQYPPALDLSTGGTRMEIGALRIEAAWDGIAAEANIGGAIFGTLEIGAFNLGMAVDGAKDFLHVDNLHFYPFGISADSDLLAIYEDGDTQGLSLKECDGWVCKTLVSYQASVTVNNDTGNYIPHVFHSVTMDGGKGRFYWQDGHGAVGSYTGQDLIEVSGGNLEFTGYLVGASNPILKQTGGSLNISGTTIETRALTNNMILQEGGYLSAVGVHLKGVAGTRTASAIKQTGGNAEIAGLTTEMLDATAALVEITSTSSTNRIDLGRNRGYKLTLPASMTAGTYAFPTVRAGGRLDFPDRLTAKTNYNAYEYPVGTVLRALDTGLEWIVDGTSTEIADMVGVKPLGEVYVDHFGAVDRSGTVASTAAFQAAADSLYSAIHLADGVYMIDDTITVTQDSKFFIGTCPTSSRNLSQIEDGFDEFLAAARCRVVWDPETSGTGKQMFLWRPAVTDGTGRVVIGGGIDGIVLDGSDAADKCLELLSTCDGTWRAVAIRSAVASYSVGCIANGVAAPDGTTGTGNASSAHNNYYLSAYNRTAGNTSTCFVGWGIGSHGNCCVSTMYNPIFICNDGIVTAHLEDSDSIIVQSGTWNNKWMLHASNDAERLDFGAEVAARHHVFFGCQGHITAKAAAVGGTSSYSNSAHGFSRGNSIARPTVEDGAQFSTIGMTDAGTTTKLGAMSVGLGPCGAQQKMAANQTIPNNTVTELVWGTTTYDALTAISSNEIFVPAGVRYAQFTLQLVWETSSTGRRLATIKVGSTTVAAVDKLANANSDTVLQTCELAVTPGDKVTATVTQSSGGDLDVLGPGVGIRTSLTARWL